MKQKGWSKILLILVISLITGILLYLYKSKIINFTKDIDTQGIINRNTDINQEFTSVYLKFNLKIPNNFTGVDEPSRIALATQEGSVYIIRNGTQYKDLDTYLSNFDKNTKLNVIKDEKLLINGYQARLRVFDDTDVAQSKEKIYFIFIDNFVYKLSTTYESLFDDLDQVAQSFRYIP